MASPNLSITIEPTVSGKARFLRTSPRYTNDHEYGILNPYIVITNNGSSAVTATKVELTVANNSTSVSKTYEKFLDGNGEFTLETAMIAAGGSLGWLPSSDMVTNFSNGQTLTVRITCQGFSDPAVFTKTLEAHVNPTPEGSYRFWAKVQDLRSGELWKVNGTSHAQTNPAQLYAFDVNVAALDGSGGRLPGTDGTKNEHSRLWGKPIYSIGDGSVLHFRNDFPTNPRPLNPGEDYAVVFPDLWALIGQVGDGNGNFVTIQTSTEVVLYAHMQPGSLNPAILSQGVIVKKGDFLGLAGNSGASSGPHLHIHANLASNTNTPPSWTGAPRPLNFRQVKATDWDALQLLVSGGVGLSQGFWIDLDSRGFPPGDLAVWPDGTLPFGRKAIAKVKDVAVSADGQPWVLRGDNAIRTTNLRFPAHGILFDVNPGGSAKKITVAGQKPYLIGMNGKIWEGRPDGWFQLANSPECVALAGMNDGTLYVVTTANRVRRWDSGNQEWPEPIGSGPATGLCAGSTVYSIGQDQRIFSPKAGQLGWVQVSNSPQVKAIALDPATNKLWAVRLDGRIVSRGTLGLWAEHPGNGVALDIVAYDGIPYVIGTDEGLWRGVGHNGWYKMNLVEP